MHYLKSFYPNNAKKTSGNCVYSQRVTTGLMGTYIAMAPSVHVDYVLFY